MSFKKRLMLSGGLNINLVVSPETIEGLKGKAFRGYSMRNAGNFKRWGTMSDLLNDEFVLCKLAPHFAAVCNAKDFATTSVTIEYPDPIGWTGIAPLENYDREALEEFSPNKRSRALRVKLDRIDLKAPQTNQLTIVFRLLANKEPPIIVVHSVYPGKDVGEIVDNISEREQIVLFDWSHPGE